MRITEITVSAGRTFNDPYEQYSNHRPSVTLKATIDENEDYTSAVASLQQKATEMVEAHRASILFDAEFEHNRQMAKHSSYGNSVPF